MSITTWALVDSLDAAMVAKQKIADVTLATDNPLLADNLLLASHAIDLDALIDARTADRIGQFAVCLAMEIDERLDCDEIASVFQLTRGSIQLAVGATRLLAGQCYRAIALVRGLRRYRPNRMAIFSLDMMPPNRVPTLIPARFQAPWPQLARLGFFESIPLELCEVKVPLPQAINETASKSFARRVVGVPLLSVLGFISKSNGISRLMTRLGFPVVFVRGDSEAIRETLGYLFVRGIGAHELRETTGKNNIIPSQPDERANIVNNLLYSILAERLSELDEFSKRQIDALAKFIMRHYWGGLEHASSKISALQTEFSNSFKLTGRPLALLGSSVSGIEGAHLYDICRRHNIPLLAFEHGITTGLSSHSESKIHFSEVVHCDELLVCSQESANSFAKVRNGAKKIRVIGLPEQVRNVKRRQLQKWLARRALGIKLKSHPVVMHVSTASFVGNLRAGPYSYTERAVVSLNQKLVRSVYGLLKGWRVIFKDYPTQRHLYEPNCAGYAGSPGSIVYADDEDFRYLRAAADVLVTMEPTSTLGWCVGASVPLVWLDSPVTRLLNEDQAQDFKNAFLFIDMRDEDWTDQLLRLLSRGLPELEKLWQAKSVARASCIQRYISGKTEPLAQLGAQTVFDILYRQRGC